MLAWKLLHTKFKLLGLPAHDTVYSQSIHRAVTPSPKTVNHSNKNGLGLLQSWRWRHCVPLEGQRRGVTYRNVCMCCNRAVMTWRA